MWPRRSHFVTRSATIETLWQLGHESKAYTFPNEKEYREKNSGGSEPTPGLYGPWVDEHRIRVVPLELPLGPCEDEGVRVDRVLTVYLVARL